jgi:hypothetical protein
MDGFLRAYIAAALWSTTDESTPEGGDFLDENYGPEDLAPETAAQMEADCASFRAENAQDIEGREAQAGHDFWLTRCGHGAGFWDGDWLEAGDRLTEACEKYPEVGLYVGDDGLIYSWDSAARRGVSRTGKSHDSESARHRRNHRRPGLRNAGHRLPHHRR